MTAHLWIAASLLANVAIIATEYLNRGAPDGRNFLGQLLYTAPLILVAQFGLFYSWKHAPAWFVAWIVFTVGNSIMRVVAVWYTHDFEVGSWALTLGGIMCMLAGSYIVKQGVS